MNKLSVYFLLVVCCLFVMDGYALAKEKHKGGGTVVLNELLKDLEKGGVSKNDLKGVDKALKNMLDKGGNKNDIRNIILGMSKDGLAGGSLIGTVNTWNDLINAGDSHKDAAGIISQLLQDGKQKKIKGTDLAALIQQVLQQRRGGLRRDTETGLDELIRDLERTGLTKDDLKGARKVLKNILHKDGSKEIIRDILVDMIRNGVTGNSFLDTILSWNDLINAGENNDKIHDILSKTLKDGNAKGLKGKELAAIIQKALKNRGI